VMAVDGAHNMWNQRFCFFMHHKMQEFYILTRSALGWSPYGGGMNDLASYLGRHPYGWEFDGAGWESHIWEECLMRIADMKWRALVLEERTPENHVRIRNIYKMIASLPVVMPDGYTFLKGPDGDGGNLTGQVGTAHDNTIMMLFCMAYAFIKLVGPDYDSFVRDFSPICLGDDCTMTVSEKIVDKFNALSIAKVLYDDIGVILETPCWEARQFHELGFLSMHFHWNEEHHTWTHKIDRDKLFSSLLQGGSIRTPDMQLQRMCNMRNVSWGHEPTRNELELLIRNYKQQYDPALSGMPAWETAKKSYVDDRMLERLYFGYQSGDTPSFNFDFDLFHSQHPSSQGVGP